MIKLIKYVIYDIVRNKFMIAYTLLLLLLGFIFFFLESDPHKGILSLLSILLLVMPLVSIIFTAIHFYNSYEFLELLAAQPLSRKSLFFSQYIGVSAAFALAFLLGIGLPVLLFEGTSKGLVLVVCGLFLTLIFVSLGFFSVMLTHDKAKGIGIALGIWFYFSVIYNVVVLTGLLTFSDYPLEKASLLATALNPIDLARILVLMQLDISALLGITGAIFQQFFTETWGVGLALLLLLAWIVIPIFIGFKIFQRKDL